MLTYKVQTVSGVGGNGLQLWNINGDFASNYGHFERFKFFGGALEGNAPPASATSWAISLISGDDTPPNLDLHTREWTNGWMLLEDYTSTDKKKTCHVTEFGYVGASSEPRPVTTGNVFNEGGGHYELLPAVTSFTISQSFPLLFGAGSQWTLFGLCPITV